MPEALPMRHQFVSDKLITITMKAVVVALFALVAVAAAVPAAPDAPKDDLKGSESVYVASPYVATYPAVSAYSAYPAAVPAYSAYSYSYPAVSAYSTYGAYAAPYAYLYR